MNGACTTDVAVIGGGLMGAASALSLVRREHSVRLFEARASGHRAGSSHGSSRIFRPTYTQQHYVEMAIRARELWGELERLTGSSLLTVNGGLDHGDQQRVERLYATLGEAGVAREIVAADDATLRWPHMRFETDVLFVPDAGVIDPELTISAMLRLARELGARIHHKTPVAAVEPSSAGVRVRTAAGHVHAGVAVVAAGPWLPQLLGRVVDLPPLTVTQQQVFHFARRADFGSGPWPVVVFDGELLAYALAGGRDGKVEGNMKLAEHTPGVVTTADERDDRIDGEGRRRVVDHVRRWWPGLVPEPVAEYTCLYTLTADEDFILDRVGPLVVCSPCSGHGAKFTPLIGEWVADLVEGGHPPYGIFGVRSRPNR